MPSNVSILDKQRLYTQLRHQLGAPIVGVELEDDMLDSLLEIAIQDYAMYVNDWLIENQWASLDGINVDEADLARAYTTRSLDWESSFTYAYSKIVGREINEIMWYSRPELNEMLVDPFLGGFGGFGGVGMGGAGGFAQMGIVGSYYMMPAYDILLRMQDRNIKNRLIGSDLTYRVTAGPEGTRYLHLYNVPGGRFDFGNSEINGARVWYWYYDVNPDNVNDCLAQNKDIIRVPSDAPIGDIEWIDLNSPARAWVRRYFTALAKETLGRVRGKFSGALKVPDSELTMDYSSLFSESQDEKTKLTEELMGRLERLREDKLMERKALVAENLNKALGYRPFQDPYNVI